jgi:hypothetical protein
MGHPAHHYPNVTSDPNMRYPISVDARVMSGGRHKKVGEIVFVLFSRFSSLAFANGGYHSGNQT